jgi:hypothetical protein
MRRRRKERETMSSSLKTENDKKVDFNRENKYNKSRLAYIIERRRKERLKGQVVLHFDHTGEIAKIEDNYHYSVKHIGNAQ